MERTSVIKAVEAHAKKYRLRLTAIGQMAVANRHAYERLKRGTAHEKTARELMAWIEGDRAARETREVSKEEQGSAA